MTPQELAKLLDEYSFIPNIESLTDFKAFTKSIDGISYGFYQKDGHIDSEDAIIISIRYHYDDERIHNAGHIFEGKIETNEEFHILMKMLGIKKEE